MPRKRFNKLPPEEQQIIVSVAAEEFAQHGYDGASMNRIIAAAGASKGAMYYWFDDKQDLFVHTATVVLRPVGAAIGKPGPVGSVDRYWQAVSGMFSRAWTYLQSDELALSMLRVTLRAHGACDLDNRWAEMMEPAHAAATELVLLGQAVGAVRDDLPIDLLIAVVIGIGEAADLWFEDRVEDLDADEVQGAVDALKDVLRRVAAVDV